MDETQMCRALIQPNWGCNNKTLRALSRRGRAFITKSTARSQRMDYKCAHLYPFIEPGRTGGPQSEPHRQVVCGEEETPIVWCGVERGGKQPCGEALRSPARPAAGAWPTTYTRPGGEDARN